jgi:hypothetical protein
MGTEGDKNSEKDGKQSIALLFSRLLWSEAEGVRIKLLFTVYVRLMQPHVFAYNPFRLFFNIIYRKIFIKNR